MPDYSFDAATLRAFGARRYPSDSAGRLAYWADLADAVGPSVLPFLVRGDKWEDIPFAELGLRKFRSSGLFPQPKEMWVLFCFRRNGYPFPADSPLRQDGFPFVLEWRKGMGDSPLLSPAFHALARTVREHLGAPDWGLHPAFGRYGDRISFADPEVFSDAGCTSSIASAWGALAAGLFCAERNRWPQSWPFPTIQWNPETEHTAGVAGIREKLSVAWDFGAEIVAVDRRQIREAQTALRTLRQEHRSDRPPIPAIFGVSAGTPAAAAGRIALGSRWKTRRQRRLLAALHVLPVLVAAAFAVIFYAQWETRNVSRQAFREVLHSLEIHAGAYNAATGARQELLEAARKSLESGKQRVFTAGVPAFRRATENALETMGKARVSDEALRCIRISKFDSSALKALFGMTELELSQAEKTLPALLGAAVSSMASGVRETALPILEQQRTVLDCNADFYALGVMELLAPAGPAPTADFRNFAKDLRFLPRFSGTWLFDQDSIDGELQQSIDLLESTAGAAETALGEAREAFVRDENARLDAMIEDGIPGNRANALLDAWAALSAKQEELDDMARKLERIRRTLPSAPSDPPPAGE